MRLDVTPQAITDDDETIRGGVVDAPVPVLLATVAHITGDLTLLRDNLRPDLTKVLEPDGGYQPEQVAAARAMAADALIRFRDGGSRPAPPPTPDEVRRLVEFVAGGPVEDAELPLLEAELALEGSDLRAPGWRVEDLTPGVSYTVGIIGAGMSGIAAAHRLHQAGVSVMVLEKNEDVGGTWLENDYPGCRVDIANHFYSYSFAQSSK